MKGALVIGIIIVYMYNLMLLTAAPHNSPDGNMTAWENTQLEEAQKEMFQPGTYYWTNACYPFILKTIQEGKPSSRNPPKWCKQTNPPVPKLIPPDPLLAFRPIFRFMNWNLTPEERNRYLPSRIVAPAEA